MGVFDSTAEATWKKKGKWTAKSLAFEKNQDQGFCRRVGRLGLGS